MAKSTVTALLIGDRSRRKLGFKRNELGRTIGVFYNTDSENQFYNTPYTDKSDGKVFKSDIKIHRKNEQTAD